MSPGQKTRSVEDVLRLIYEGTASAIGREFFSALVRATARAMNVRWAFVSEFAGSRSRVRTVAFWAGDDFAENFEYDLDGTVCEGVLSGQLGYYPRRVAEQFPREPALTELGVESYLATPMLSRDGRVMGHLAVFDTKPMAFAERDLEVFQIFGARAAAELDRLNALAAVERSEARLANILDSTQDAIITINAKHQIELFNGAAVRMFRCAAEWAIGQPFDRFLSQPFRQVLGHTMDAAQADAQALWAPEGMTAVRADGEAFPIEATISPVMQGTERLYTVIMRDINEREEAAREIGRLQSENIMLKQEFTRAKRFQRMIGESAAMRNIFEQIEVVAATDATVLLVGDTGTGKELLSTAIHNLSRRRDAMLVSVNCAALPSELIESELFGHEKGAFTGATDQRKGRFELADKGTIFLDEVGELTAEAQAKLLRALQEQSFERVGGTRTLQVDVRVVAATNRDLLKMVDEGTFRSDLFYRLNVFPIRVPSLHERSEDIPLLAGFFLDQLRRKLGKELERIDESSLERLTAYSWPGNVRELQNVIERAAILSRGPVVSISDTVFVRPPEIASSIAISGSLDDVQRARILEVLDTCHGQIEGRNGAAVALGLKPSTLRYRMQKLGIKK